MRRIVRPELLDDDLGTPAEVAASLADVRRINRWFGGSSSATALLRQVARARSLRQLTVLDVGGASGDVMTAAQGALAQEGIELRPTILDRARTHLNGRFPAVVGEARALPFCDAGFDVVYCGLFLHHLEPDEIVHFANQALRVARVAFVASDLRRHPLHLGLVYSGTWLYRSRLTRHDAPASVRRSYTEEEMRKIVGQTAAARVEMTRFYLFRMGIVAWKAQ